MRFNFGWGQAGKSTKLTKRSDACACAGFGLATKSICLYLTNYNSSFCAFVQTLYNTVDILVFSIII